MDQAGGRGPLIWLFCTARALRFVNEAQDSGRVPVNAFSITCSSSILRELIA